MFFNKNIKQFLVQTGFTPLIYALPQPLPLYGRFCVRMLSVSGATARPSGNAFYMKRKEEVVSLPS